MEKRLKKLLIEERGITLVALIITVILMLILAGVAISAVIDGDGLFRKSREATESYENAAKDEARQLENLMNKVGIYLDDISNDNEEPKDTDDEDLVQGILMADNVKVGEYVNYEAGIWTEDDLSSITQELTLDDGTKVTPTLHDTVRTKTSASSTTLPNKQGQFGGFVLGQSRDTNSKHYGSYVPESAGWIVWSIKTDEQTGKKYVTLISAGHPETYYNATNYSTQTVGILRKRNFSMYVDENFATKAEVLTGQELAEWYNTHFPGNDYKIEDNGGRTTTTFFRKTFTNSEPISVLENNSQFWLATAYSSTYLYTVSPSSRYVGINEGGSFAFRYSSSCYIKTRCSYREGYW